MGSETHVHPAFYEWRNHNHEAANFQLATKIQSLSISWNKLLKIKHSEVTLISYEITRVHKRMKSKMRWRQPIMSVMKRHVKKAMSVGDRATFLYAHNSFPMDWSTICCCGVAFPRFKVQSRSSVGGIIIHAEQSDDDGGVEWLNGEPIARVAGHVSLFSICHVPAFSQVLPPMLSHVQTSRLAAILVIVTLFFNMDRCVCFD